MPTNEGVLRTINATFRDAVESDPDRVYLDFSGDAYTYRRMATEIERFARGLHALGVQRGDRVVALLDNSPDAVIAWYAANRIGATHVPINTAYKGEYLRHQVNDSGAPSSSAMRNSSMMCWQWHRSCRRSITSCTPVRRNRASNGADRSAPSTGTASTTGEALYRGGAVGSVDDPLHLRHHRTFEGLHGQP